LLLTVLDTVELECLPTDLPQSIEVDVSSLADVGSAVHVRDLDIDKAKCELKTDPDEVVVLISAPQVIREEISEAEAEAAEGAAAEASGSESSADETSS